MLSNKRILRIIFGTGNGCCCGISSTASAWNNNFYEALGIPQSSTQTDIKAAYYKLSKQYHPDKNQGSDSASKKFREISQAYEVLGNYKLRRLYDKGIIHTAGSQFARRPEPAYDDFQTEEEDDAQTKFYKSRFKKSKVMDATGRTPIYDFDEWSRAHYGKSFQRRQDAKNKFDRQEMQKQYDISSTQNEIILFVIVFIGVFTYILLYVEKSSYDVPNKRVANNPDDDSSPNR